MNASLKDLEKALNLSAPSIYHSYGNKESLFIKSIDYYIENVVDKRLNQYLKQDKQPLDNIQSFITSLVNNSEVVKSKMGCLLTNTATELGVTIPEVSIKIQQGLDKIEDALYLQLKQAREYKQLKSKKSLSELTSLLFLGYQGLLVLLKLNYSEAKLKQAANPVLTVLD